MLHASANQEGDATTVTTTAESAAEASALDTASILCVEPGDTLWKIAKTYGPDDVSVKSYVQSIIETNDLDSAGLQVGQVLRLP
jgi:LysM repeat protein